MSDDIIVVEPDGSKRPSVQDAVESITNLLREGETVQVIAARLNLDPGKVLQVRDEIDTVERSEEDNGLKLNTYLTSLDEILDIAHWQAKSDPTPNNIYAYTALLEAARAIIQDLDGRRDPKAVQEALLQSAVQPLVQQIIGGLTIKLAETRKALFDITAEDHHGDINALLDDIMRALGAAISDGMVGFKDKTEKVLSSKPATRPAKVRK